MMQLARWTCILVAGSVAAMGCSDGRPTRVPVSGKVLLDGEPLTRGYIRFVPADARPSGGMIAEDGTFTLQCYDGADGAVVGMHRIEIQAHKPMGMKKIHWPIPKKYANFKTSGLKFEVREATDNATIELTWDGGKPFTEEFQ